MIKRVLIVASFFTLPFAAVSQGEKEDPTKMFRDVVPVQVDRSKFAPATPPTPTVEATTDAKGKKKKKVEEPPVEPAPDTLSPMIPAPSAEIVKRAQNWYMEKNTKFTKTNGSNSGKSVSCNVQFVYKQKLLNPENDVDGKFTMDVIIEAKEGKYRYTVKNIKHVANKQGMSGGDIYAKIPEAGSMAITDRTWKHLKSDAFACAKIVIDDFKAKIAEEVPDNKDEW
ncbi:MAG: hypothetical protein K0S32_2533 [Bacteroidetes bacterium]|jgi:hypothetical protein|nr:hypothetical protein [Bacteroidota bacterium]